MGTNENIKVLGAGITKKVPKEYLISIFNFLLVVLFFLVITKGRSLALSNLALIADIAFPTMIVALGAVFIYAHGGIDFSLGAVQGLSMMMCALVMQNSTNNIVVGIIAAIGTSLVAGLILAFIRVTFRIPALVASLCVQSLAKGILQAVTMSRSVTVPVGMVVLDNTYIKVGMLAAMAVISIILFEYTRVGKGDKALGANAVAARLMGVNDVKIIYFSHLLTSLAVGISAVFAIAQVSQIVATSGSGMETDVLVAAVVGGMSLTGGSRTKIINILIGSVIVAFLTNGFSVWGVAPTVIQGIKGLIFIVTVLLTRPKDRTAILP